MTLEGDINYFPKSIEPLVKNVPATAACFSVSGMMIFDITIAPIAERIDEETRCPAIVGNLE